MQNSYVVYIYKYIHIYLNIPQEKSYSQKIIVCDTKSIHKFFQAFLLMFIGRGNQMLYGMSVVFSPSESMFIIALFLGESSAHSLSLYEFLRMERSDFFWRFFHISNNLVLKINFKNCVQGLFYMKYVSNINNTIVNLLSEE